MTRTKKLALFAFLMTGLATPSFAQMKIGGAPGPANASAYLQLGDTLGAKGLLLPRVALSATNVWGLSGNTPLAGMVVYNTVTAGTAPYNVAPGYYFNDGTQWVAIVGKDSILSIAKDWQKMGSNTAAKNSDHQYISGRAAIGQDSSAVVDARGTPAKFTTAGGDACINGLTVGMGSGQLAYNTALGYQSLYKNQTANGNTAIGRNTLFNYTTGTGSTAVGTWSLTNIIGGDLNTAIGYQAMTGEVGNKSVNNIAIGPYSLQHVRNNDSNNIAIGIYTLNNMPGGGIGNTVAGHYAGMIINGHNNLVLGSHAGQRFIGSGNVFMGTEAAYNIATNDAVVAYNNTFVGSKAGSTHLKGDHNIILGANQNLVKNGYGESKDQMNLGGIIFGTGLTGNETAPAGNIGIGTTAPAYKLDVSGDINADGNVKANGVILSSDIRYKQNIATITNASGLISQIRGAYYTFRTGEFPQKSFDNRQHAGFIAQELEQIIPWVVNTDKNGYKSVNYIEVIPILATAIREQQSTIEDLRAVITEMKKEIAALKATH